MRNQIKDEDENFENGENGKRILKDKHTYHVDVRLCDALSKSVAKQASRQHLTDAHGNSGDALHRPGYRVLEGGNANTQAAWDAIDRATEQAYAADEHFKTHAWRDAILDENDDEDLYEAKQSATDAYAAYEAEIRDAYKRGNE